MLPWSSLFSDNISSTLTTIESWISSIFFFLFLITVGPWFIFLAYDLILYVFRTVTYEIPFIGGRARGKERPRAPSLKERPTGDPRVMGIGVPAAPYLEPEDIEQETQQASGQHSPQSDDGGQEYVPASVPLADTVPTASYPDRAWMPGVVDDRSPSQNNNEDGGDGRAASQRVFSIGGADERENWTEENARRRIGFNDDEGPG